MIGEFRVLVADDEESFRGVVSEVLNGEGYEVITVPDGEAALEVFRKTPFPLVMTDLKMAHMSGLDLLREVKTIQTDTEVVMITGNATIESAVNSLRAGAYDYLVKPVEDLELISAVARRALEKSQLSRKNLELIGTLRRKNEELQEINLAIKELAIRDGLTGLYNHRYFQEALTNEFNRAKRYKHPFSLLFIDIDHFKQYNDTHGHLEGDQLLRNLCSALKSRLRGTDMAARYGGEEFVILLPETGRENAVQVAEDLRQRIANHSFSGRDQATKTRVTISIGVATFPDHGTEMPALLNQADQALYRAKRGGRNRVC